MQISFETRDAEALPLRAFVEQRVRLVLRRLQPLVKRARVALADVNGPRGGLDKRCQVELQTSAGTVWITSLASDCRAALEGALSRAVRLVARLTQRRRARERRRLSPQLQS